MMKEGTGRKELENHKNAEGGQAWSLILHNDDVHTFEFVIAVLMEILDHSAEQAEQCATLTHLKGSCLVRKGLPGEIRQKHLQLAEKGLTVTIDS